MLDDVQAGALLVEPAGECAAPLAVRRLHVQLHERTGELLLFPGGGLFAGAQLDDDIAQPGRLAGLQRHVAGDTIALVQQADDSDTLRHRRRSGVDRRLRTGIHRLDRIRAGGRVGNFDRNGGSLRHGHVLPGQRGIAEPAACPHARHQNARGEQPPVHPSGVQAS
ncbi:hypothetical protein ASE75_00910 [Sphingomonas sp. Leaf17]|nr:hypothetical protein ASE75_00910 [Sphingomonas sp. Leaf17]